MAIVVDKARPATRPTNGQFVEILQSFDEPHIPSIEDMGDTEWNTRYAAQGTAPGIGGEWPTADDRAHRTGNDANQSAKSGNLLTDTFVSWTTIGDVVQGSKGNSEGLLWEGTTGTIGNPSEASGEQGLSAGFDIDDFVELKFKFEHRKKSLLSITFIDDVGQLDIGGITGGLPGDAAEGLNDIYLAGVTRRATVGTVKMKLIDSTGDMQADAYNFTITKTPSRG